MPNQKSFFEDETSLYAVNYYELYPNSPKPAHLRNFNFPPIKIQKEGAELFLGFTIWCFDNYIKTNPIFAVRALRTRKVLEGWIKAPLSCVTNANTRDYFWFLCNSIIKLGEILASGGEVFCDNVMRAIFVSGWKPCFDKMHGKTQSDIENA